MKEIILSLNPCSTGQYLDTVETRQYLAEKVIVLILVLLDNTLIHVSLMPYDEIKDGLNPCSTGQYLDTAFFGPEKSGLICLNPCSTGQYLDTVRVHPPLQKASVLILVLLDNTLIQLP